VDLPWSCYVPPLVWAGGPASWSQVVAPVGPSGLWDGLVAARLTHKDPFFIGKHGPSTTSSSSVVLCLLALPGTPRGAPASPSPWLLAYQLCLGLGVVDGVWLAICTDMSSSEVHLPWQSGVHLQARWSKGLAGSRHKGCVLLVVS
jgi:hypothetical protein